MWQAARAVADGGSADDAWREEVRGLRSQGRLKGPAQALLLLEAARRRDADAVAALLDETDAWRGFRAAPPRSVTQAVAAVVAAQPNHPSWRRGLARWVQIWGAAFAGAGGGDVGRAGGVGAGGRAGRSAPADASGAVVPAPGGAALGRDDAEALAYVRRALQADADLATVADAEAMRAALPDLERRAAPAPWPMRVGRTTSYR